MHDYEPTQEDLDDAIVEDTFHCAVCSAAANCGGNDAVIIDRGKGLCVECAAEVHRAYLAAQAEMGLCPHGECLSQPCAECLAPISLCKQIVRFWGSREAWGDFASLTSAAGAFGPIADQARLILEGRPLTDPQAGAPPERYRRGEDA